MPSGQGQNMIFLAILKVNGANWLLVLERKMELGKKSTIAMLGPLLAMPSGQGLNMILLAILKVNGTNWLLVLEIKLELRGKIYYWQNITIGQTTLVYSAFKPRNVIAMLWCSMYENIKNMFSYIHTYIHTSIHPSIHPSMHACMHACMHAYIHTYIHYILGILGFQWLLNLVQFAVKFWVPGVPFSFEV